MIVLKDKGKNSKIYIPRTKITNVTGGNNTTDLTDYYTKEEVDELIDNVEVDLTNYYTKEQVDELTANSSISYAVFDYDENDVVNLVAGDISKVFEDYKQHKPIMIFAPVDNRGKMGIVNCLQLLLEENGYDNDYLIGYVNYFDGDSITYRRYTFNHFGTTGYSNATKNFLNYYTKTESDAKYITKGVGATIDYVDGEIGKLDSSLTSKINQKQDTLVSGTNIKTINGNSLLGSGDIVVEGGSSSNIVELTQAEYDALSDNVDADTLYLISDATISANYKTVNGESILGEGNIEISVPDEYVTDTELTNKGYATTTYVDTQIGNINTILENIIG